MITCWWMQHTPWIITGVYVVWMILVMLGLLLWSFVLFGVTLVMHFTAQFMNRNHKYPKP